MSQMRGTTILWGQFLVAFLILGLAVQAATQYVAHKLGYQDVLGEPVVVILGWSLYWPWQYWVWLYHYDYYAKTIFFQGSLIIYASAFITFGAMVFMSVRRARRNKNPDTYGTARWATDKDLDAAGLLAQNGIVLGQTEHEDILRHDGAEHCFVFAPTRSGKGISIVLPTLLSWRGSTIVYDTKRENWAYTAGWRQQFSHVLRFEPTAEFSVRFNPLLEVRKGANEVRDAQTIADILVDPDGSKERLDHWDKTSHALLTGVILHVLYAEREKSLNGVAAFLSSPQQTIYQTLDRMLKTQHTQQGTHPVVASVARELLNKSENELSGVLSTAMSFLSLYRDPLIAKNTAASDVAIKDLMNAEYPVSLYLVVPPSDIDRLRPLVRLLLNQIGRRLTEQLDSTASAHEQNPHKHRLLMLLDEFPTLGKLSFFESELAYMAGYGIRALMIAQSLNQVEKAYGANNSILDNSHIRVTYGTLDERTAKRISDMLGTATENRRQTNYAGHRLAPWLGHVMVSEQESPRPLLTPGEVLQFPPQESLVMVGGHPPYRGRKLRVYKDQRFVTRLKLDAPESPAAQVKELKGLSRQSVWLSRKNGISAQPTVSANTGFAQEQAKVLKQSRQPKPASKPKRQHTRHKMPPLHQTATKQPVDDHDVTSADSHQQLQAEQQRTQEITQQRQRLMEQGRDMVGKGFI